MKQILLLSAALLISSSAIASDIRTATVQPRLAQPTAVMARQTCTKAPAARSTESGAIIETPAGKLIGNMTMSEFALYPRGFEIYMRMVSGKVSAIVEGEDGCLYVKNPVGVYDTGSWLKLEHKEGTVYVAKLPQAASAPWEYEGEEVWFNYDRLDFDEDEGYYYPSFQESELSFNYENGVLTSIGEIGEDDDIPVMLGLTYNIYGPDDPDEAWAWFGVNNITVRPLEVAPAELPEGVTGETKLMTSSAGQARAWVAVDGSDIYLRPGESYGYAIGKIADGQAVFESSQYLGVSGNSHCYFMGAVSEFIEDDDYYDGGYTVYRPADDLTFDYNVDGVILQSENALVINEGDMSYYAKTICDKPVITDYIVVEGTPVDPEIVRYEPYDDWDEYGVFVFDLPTETTTGETISTVDMYYNIFADGSDEPYVFSPSMYELIDSPVTNVPYDFSDGGFAFTVNGIKHTVVIYEEMGNIGVQSINVANGKEYKSHIVWSNGETTGIESVTVEPAADEELYDLMGRRVTTPRNGIFIRRCGNAIEKIIIK